MDRLGELTVRLEQEYLKKRAEGRERDTER
jgi:hypothetical protein